MDNIFERTISNIDIEKNNDLVMKYLQMGLEKNNVKSIYLLARYYSDIDKNDELMIKYLNLGIEKDCGECMLFLGRYYLIEENNNLQKELLW